VVVRGGDGGGVRAGSEGGGAAAAREVVAEPFGAGDADVNGEVGGRGGDGEAGGREGVHGDGDGGAVATPSAVLDREGERVLAVPVRVGGEGELRRVAGEGAVLRLAGDGEGEGVTVGVGGQKGDSERLVLGGLQVL